MQLVTGDIWSAYERASLFLFPANGYVSKDGRFLMDTGMALEVREQFPNAEIEKRIGAQIKRQGQYVAALGCWQYGLLVSPQWPKAKLGAIQNRWHWKKEANLGLIWHSIQKLKAWLSNHPEAAEVHMPMLAEDTLPYPAALNMLSELPENVFVWTTTEWFERPHYEIEAEDVKNIEALFGGDPDNFWYGEFGKQYDEALE